jgi:hypothetical protein
MVTVIWVTKCNRLRMRDMGFGGIMEILFYLCCYDCIGNPTSTLILSLPLKVGHLKLAYGW